MSTLQAIIEGAFDDRASLTPNKVSSEIKHAIQEVIHQLDSGKSRVAEKINDQWQVNQWVKKAVLLYFRIHDNEMINGN